MPVSAPQGRHFRAARAWFGWSRDRVSAASGLDVATIGRAEADWPRLKPESADRLAAWWSQQGVRFLFRSVGGGIEVTQAGPRPVPSGDPGE